MFIGQKSAKSGCVILPKPPKVMFFFTTGKNLSIFLKTQSGFVAYELVSAGKLWNIGLLRFMRYKVLFGSHKNLYQAFLLDLYCLSLLY